MITLTRIDYGPGHPQRNLLDALCSLADRFWDEHDINDECGPNEAMHVTHEIVTVLEGFGETDLARLWK